jgi:septal ring factor EnvC (AmiA/AmiB activator)
MAPSRNDVIILAGMAKVTATLGQELISGEPIGTMPTVIEDRPQLYVEVRKGTKVLDASAWVDPWNGARHDS